MVLVTRKKEMSSSLREKRGTSPSPSATSSTSSKTVSTSRSLEKSTPNYLKPTLSSASASGDATKLHACTDSALRLARRRSFDKPPSPTRTPKARGVSPTPTFRSSSFSSPSRALKTRGVSPTPSFRSSSFSGKATTSPKGGRDAGKQPSLYARSVSNVKKSPTFLGKNAAAAASTKDPKIDNVVSESSDQESPIADADAEADDQQMVDEHEGNEETQEMDGETITQQLEAEIQKVDSPTFLEEDDADTAKAASPTVLEKTEHVQVESPAASEQHDSSNDDNAAKVESPKSMEHREEVPEDLEETHEEVKEDTSSTNPDHESVADDPNEEVKEKESNGAEAGEVVVEDENVAAAAAPKEAHGKKDLALSNNVIEETAKMQLREQRRNKVKALASAFETVISLQDKGNNNS